MTDILHFGIIGCGVIADFHAKAIQVSENGELTGVADISYDRAADFGKKYAVHAYASAAEMLADPKIDAVCVCTPSGFHTDCALQVIAANKHILIEKPLAVKTEDCEKIIRAASEKGICAGSIFQCRFTPAVIKVREMLRENQLGKIISADLIMNFYRSQEYYDSSNWRGTWELDGGSLMNQGIHGVDTMLHLMGDVKRVFGYSRTLAHTMEAEDTTVAALEFENGALGLIQSTTAVYPGSPRRLIITGTNGSVTIVDDKIEQCILNGADCTVEETTEGEKFRGFNNPADISNAGHIYQIQNFIDSVFSGIQPAVPLEEAYRTVQLINSVYESSFTKAEVFPSKKAGA